METGYKKISFEEREMQELERKEAKEKEDIKKLKKSNEEFKKLDNEYSKKFSEGKDVSQILKQQEAKAEEIRLLEDKVFAKRRADEKKVVELTKKINKTKEKINTINNFTIGSYYVLKEEKEKGKKQIKLEQNKLEKAQKEKAILLKEIEKENKKINSI